VASFPEDAADARALVQAADAALLGAKAQGKDRVGKAWERG
jgi:PleD family two-component response regulator